MVQACRGVTICLGVRLHPRHLRLYIHTAADHSLKPAILFFDWRILGWANHKLCTRSEAGSLAECHCQQAQV